MLTKPPQFHECIWHSGISLRVITYHSLSLSQALRPPPPPPPLSHIPAHSRTIAISKSLKNGARGQHRPILGFVDWDSGPISGPVQQGSVTNSVFPHFRCAKLHNRLWKRSSGVGNEFKEHFQSSIFRRILQWVQKRVDSFFSQWMIFSLKRIASRLVNNAKTNIIGISLIFLVWRTLDSSISYYNSNAKLVVWLKNFCELVCCDPSHRNGL